MILAGDIGGTKTYLALFDWKTERVDPVRESMYWSGDYSSFEEVLTEFLAPPAASSDREEETEEEERPDQAEAHAEPTIDAACFGVPGPVLGNQSRTTNLPWTIEGEALKQPLETMNVKLLNDLEATAHGLLILRPEETEVLNAGTSSAPQATKALIAAGTGLGEAILFWDGERYHPSPSEGGHASFAPTGDREIELLRYLRTSYLHVSFERVLSGAGLHAIYQFLRDTQKNEPTWFAERLPTEDPASLIAQAGLDGKPEICVQALDLFLSIYGAEAGNLALKTLATGGVYIGGGIAPKLLSKLREGTFMRAFAAKGRYKRLLGTIPVHVILNDKTALLGAASVAAGLVHKS